MTGFPLLTLIVFLPWAGALLLAALPRLADNASRAAALLFSLSTLALGLAALGSFDPAHAGYQFVERHAWIRALNVDYHLGMDGMSLLLVLLTGLVGPVSLLASWRQARNPRFFGIVFLLLQGSALGVFLALDFFPWFLFWELSLFPAFFLIKLWGGPGASRAAYQFVIYTVAGSAFMLMGFAAIYAAAGTFDFEKLSALAASGDLGGRLALLGGFWPKAVFIGVLLGLAVKAPLFPFHTWLPPAYAEAPTGAAMFLTGVMSKMGVYGFFRILWPLFPEQLHRASGPLLWLALGGAVFGALAAMRQTDLKRMMAYSSVNHVSYCLLALFAVTAAKAAGAATAASALDGAILQMFNHGLTAAALFFCVGILESRSGRRGIGDFGGVRAVAPVFAGLCGVAMFSSLGLPGLNGFVGEFLVFRGVFGLAPWIAAIACLGLLATVIFLLRFWQRVFHGPADRRGRLREEVDGLPGASCSPSTCSRTRPQNQYSLTPSEFLPLAAFAALMFLFGVLPQLLIGLFNPLVTGWVAHLP